MFLQDETGRFTRRHENNDFNSSLGNSSVTTVPPLKGSVFDERRVPPTHYEPGNSAEFMMRSGYHLHDKYNRSTRVDDADGVNVKRGASLHRITFSHSLDYKRLYLSALIVVTLMLITLIVIILILFATKVFVVNTVMPLNQSRYSAPSGRSVKPINGKRIGVDSSTPYIPRGSPPRPEPSVAIVKSPQSRTPQSLPSLTQAKSEDARKRPLDELETQPPPVSPTRWHSSSREDTLKIVTHSFECEFYILMQRNAAYENVHSFEYRQATANIQDALNSLTVSPVFHNQKPVVNLVQIENSANDLRVVFRLSVKSAAGYGGGNAIDDAKVRDELLRELPRFETILNGIEIDRARIAVQIIGEM